MEDKINFKVLYTNSILRDKKSFFMSQPLFNVSMKHIEKVLPVHNRKCRIFNIQHKKFNELMEKIENVLQDITSYFLYEEEVMLMLLLLKYIILKK